MAGTGPVAACSLLLILLLVAPAGAAPPAGTADLNVTIWERDADLDELVITCEDPAATGSATQVGGGLLAIVTIDSACAKAIHVFPSECTVADHVACFHEDLETTLTAAWDDTWIDVRHDWRESPWIQTDWALEASGPLAALL